MARLPRLAVPGHPHHVIQRGNNRQAIFRDAADRELLLGLLADYSRREKVAIHSYVLMDNHFHLLVTPETEKGLPLMMQAVGRRYVQHFNKRHGRTGGLWEGRYKSTVVETDRYLLACMVYIDLNPIRAGLAGKAGEHRWCSYHHYVGVKHDPLVTPHPLYWQLGNTPFEREAAYGELVNQGIDARRQAELTEAVLKGWVLGEPTSLSNLQRQTPRRLQRQRPGRPPIRPKLT